MRELYAEQGRKLYDELLEIFAKIAADSQDGKIYLNDLYRTNNYHLLLEHFNKCAAQLGGRQVKITEESLLEVYRMAQEVVGDNVPRDAIATTFSVPSAINPEQAIHQTWCLDGREFSARIWQNKQALVQDLAHTMADFTVRGESPYTIARGIVERFSVDEYCAYRIARTETAHAQIAATSNKYKELGFTHCRFNATDPCDDCRELHGKLFTLDEIQGLIPKHPNCECSFLLEVGD